MFSAANRWRGSASKMPPSPLLPTALPASASQIMVPPSLSPRCPAFSILGTICLQRSPLCQCPAFKPPRASHPTATSSSPLLEPYILQHPGLWDDTCSPPPGALVYRSAPSRPPRSSLLWPGPSHHSGLSSDIFSSDPWIQSARHHTVP